MYPDNIYIQNYAEVDAMGGDIGVCLDKYWRSVETGADLMSAKDKQLLGL